MPQVPGSLAELVSVFAGCFTQPTFRTFRALLVAFITRVGEHTITGCLVAGGVAGGWHHSRGHRFFSRARLVAVVKPGLTRRIGADLRELRVEADIATEPWADMVST